MTYHSEGWMLESVSGVGWLVRGLLSSVVNLSKMCLVANLESVVLNYYFYVGAVHRRLGFALAAFN